MNALYLDPNRKSGSQAEKPVAWHDRQFICFDGYQRFCLSPNKIKLRKLDHRKKYSIVRPYLLGQVSDVTSIIDLGCSAGAMGFQAYFDGFRNVKFIDHDPEYLHLVQAGLKHIGASAPTIQRSKVQDVTSVADVLFAFAIIHWLYSCTEDFGSLGRTIDKLSTLCRKAMFIEWIGPECRDIQSFGHLSHNPTSHLEQYTRENFIRALESKFPYVKRIGKVRLGREIWLASHSKWKPSPSILLRQRIVTTTNAMFSKAFSSERGIRRRT